MCFHLSGNILSAANASGLPVTMDILAWGFMLGEENHSACFSYCVLAEAFHDVQFLALAMAAESLGLSSISSIAFKWKKGRRVLCPLQSTPLEHCGSAQLELEK